MKLLVTTTGDERKVACESCIKGHRVAKCQHVDRVLFEVRPPGRPLGGCPHPVGKCPGHCTTRYQPAFVVPGHVGMKTHDEDGSQYVEGRPIELHEYPDSMRPKEDRNLSKTRKSEDIASKGQKRRRDRSQATDSPLETSDISSLTSGESPKNADKNRRHSVTNTGEFLVKDVGEHDKSSKTSKDDKLRLGMMGVGGYGSGGDEVAWGGDWPDSSSREEIRPTTPLPPAKKNCCCSSLEQPGEPSSSTHATVSRTSTSSQITAPTNLNSTPCSNDISVYFDQSQAQDVNSFDSHANFPFTFTPLPAVAASQIDPRYGIDDCSCLSEQQCHCYGCAKHPGNPTHQSKNQELWDLQGNETYLQHAAQSLSTGTETRLLENENAYQSDLFNPNVDDTSTRTYPFKHFSSLDNPTPYQNVMLKNSLPHEPAPSTPYEQSNLPYTINSTTNSETTTFEPYILHPSQYYSCMNGACACGSGCKCVGCRVHGIHQPCDNYTMGNCKCGEGCACYGCVTQHLHSEGPGLRGGGIAPQMMQVPVTWGGENPHLDCSGRLLGGSGTMNDRVNAGIQSHPRASNGSSSCCDGGSSSAMQAQDGHKHDQGRGEFLAAEDFVDFGVAT